MAVKHTEKRPKPTYHECWTIGDNQYGQQMNGTRKTVRELESVKTLDKRINIKNIISGNKGSIYILCNDNKLIVCGQNEVGELGVFDTIIENIIIHWSQIRMTIPNDIIISIREFTPKHIPDSISFISKPIMIRQFKIKHISNGIASNHKFIINHKNQIYGFGSNQFHQISVSEDQGSKKKNSFTKIDYFTQHKITISQIECTYHCTVFLSDNGDIYKTGNHRYVRYYDSEPYKQRLINDYMQKLDTPNKIKTICCGYAHTVCIDINHKVIAFGSNSHGQCCCDENKDERYYHMQIIDDPKQIEFFNDKNIVNISCGARHSMILDNNGNVYICGDNEFYQIGMNEACEEKEYIPVLNEYLKDENVVDIKCGYYHNIAKTDKNEYYLWGNNTDSECLVFVFDHDDDEYVKIPTKYICKEKEIAAIYPGFYATRILYKSQID